MTANLLKYSMDDIYNIKNDGFIINIDNNIYSLLNNLQNQLNPLLEPISVIKEFNKITQIPSNNICNKINKKRRKNNEIIDNTEWEAMRNFSATNIITKCDGIESKINIIRSCLNKVSDKTFDKEYETIYNILNEIINNENNNSDIIYTEKDIITISKCIFDIASNNKFYSELYAKLYSKLISHFSVMHDVFFENFNVFTELFENIKYVNPNIDYDGFCDNNKLNEQRRSISMFFVNLSLNNVINPIKLIEIINGLLELINEYILLNEKINEVNELSEILFILIDKKFINSCINDISVIKETSSKHSDDDTIDDSISSDDDISYDNITNSHYGDIYNVLQKIKGLAEKKTKDFPGLSNKSKFKFMDINDKYKSL
jgi:hypothetical protein